MATLIAAGIAILDSGTVTVETGSVLSTDVILTTNNSYSFTSDNFAHRPSYHVPGSDVIEDTSFVINSLAYATEWMLDESDNSTVNWVIIRP